MTTPNLIHTLLVEDNPQDVQTIRKLVTQASPLQFSWEHVSRLEEAKDRLHGEPFDLVLLDLSLPDSQGLHTFTELYPHAICLPVVVLSSTQDELLAIQLLRSGAQDCLIKARMEPEALVQALRHAIERKQVETALRARNQELAQLADQLSPQTKFSPSLHNLAAIFIHELNNPLVEVSARLENLFPQFDSDDPRRAALESIYAEVEQMGHLVANLLQASLQNAGQENVAITESLQDILSSRLNAVQTEESNFFEALGAWVLDYISSSKKPVSRSLDKSLQKLRSSRSEVSEPLSQRERQVVYLVAKGYTNKEIAKQLSLSVRTVERYSTSIMNKLGLHNRVELIVYAIRQGLINGEDVPDSHRKIAPE